MNEDNCSAILGAFILILIMFLGVMVGKSFARQLTINGVVAQTYSVKVIDDTLYVETNMRTFINSKEIR